MTVTILPNIMGIFAFNENGEIFSKKLFVKRDDVAEKLYSVQANKLIPEFIELLNDIKEKEVNELLLEDNELAQEIKEKFKFKIQIEKPSPVGKKVRAKLFELGKSLNVFKTEDEFKKYLQEINIQLTRKKVKKASERKDKLIIQAIESVDDIDKALNIFSARMREWYGLHFPELDKEISNHTTFLKLISQFGFRTKYKVNELTEIMNYTQEKAKKISSLAKNSMGSQIQEIDLLPLQHFASEGVVLYKLRDTLAKYIDEAMLEVAPNLRGMVGAMLGARLISAAGGIMELAQKPSSTVQVLGAERALFRSLKTGAKPPKHGIIFQWEPIYNAKWWLRGKIARATASKLSIAARVDAFSGEYVADDLLDSLNSTINALNAKYKEPPKKKKEVIKEKKEKKKKRDKKRRKKWNKSDKKKQKKGKK